MYCDSVIKYVEHIKERNIARQQEKLVDYMMLLNIIHAEDPGEIYDKVKEQVDEMDRINEDESKELEEETDLDAIDKFRQKREMQGYNKGVR